MIKFNRKDIPDKFLLAISGGVDSTAIAHLLSRKQYDFSLIHINNKLVSSDGLAAAKIEKLAKYLDKQLYLVEASGPYQSKSKEQWARNERLLGFELVCKQYNFKHIVTAHGLHDMVSGYLINVLRGCPEFAPLPKQSIFESFNIIRPFINADKDSLIKYAKINDLNKFITYDELNDDISLQRNWVRLKLLPLIQERTNLSTVVRKKFLIK